MHGVPWVAQRELARVKQDCFLAITGARRASALGVVGLVRLGSCNAALGGLEQNLLQPVGEDDGRKVRQDGVGARLHKEQPLSDRPTYTVAAHRKRVTMSRACCKRCKT